MKSLDAELTVLSNELQQLDYVVVHHGDYICVRAPLISSVRVRHQGDGRFRFEPLTGPFKRATALWITSGVSTAAVAAAATIFGFAPLTVVLGFVGVVALAHDACRFVITEGLLTRMQQLIAARGARGPLTTSQHPLIGEPAQYTFLDQRVADTTAFKR